MSYTPSNRRLVKNTMFMYSRTFLLMIIGVFTSRITLEALGVNGYGTINVVSGFVGLFSIISGSLTAACQRFITYEMEAKNHSVQDVFNASLKIHILLCLALILIAETVGLYFVEYKLNIPADEYKAVQWVYQCSIASLLLTLVNIPYNAIIISYERLNVFAYMSLFEGVLKFLVVLLLLYLPGDKLVIYSLLTLGSAIIMRTILQMYCHKQFRKEVKIRIKTNSVLFKNIFGFAGWTFLGNAATICSNQGVNIVINLFCGVVVNAARGIAVMVEGIITSFVTNFTTALNPQITKSYASNNDLQIIELVQLGIRITFFLMLLISVPVIIAADDILHIWFVEVPEYAVSFVRLTLIIAIIQAFGNPFLTLLLATGKIRSYQITVGVITIMNLPISYLLLYLRYSPESVYILNIAISVIAFILRLIYLNKITRINTAKYFDNILIRMILSGAVCVALSSLLYNSFTAIDNFLKLVAFGAGSVLISIVTIVLIGINASDRSKIASSVCYKLKG